MKIIFYTLLLSILPVIVSAQDLYFPPIEGDEWETMDPSELGWCTSKIDSFYNFLGARNSKAFLLLKDGKIVLEKYYDDFTPTDTWYWASVGKSMMAVLTGIAQQDSLLNIDNPTSDYLGAGWTSAPLEKEVLITPRHHLTMTAGLDDAVNNVCTDAECLQYLADAGTRWAYHNATYYLMADVIAAASGKDFNQYFHDEITKTTGITGQWEQFEYARILFTTPRDMARFGLLNLNNGYWGATPILKNPDFFNSMINPSQDFNQSYGYYWWLNGQNSHMFPGTQFIFPGSLAPDAPADLYTGIGNNGQYVNIVPSQGMVLVRMGDNPGGPPAPNIFNNEMWQYINDLSCITTSVQENQAQSLKLYPNPTNNFIQISLPTNIKPYTVSIYDLLGRESMQIENTANIDVSNLPKGIYQLTVHSNNARWSNSFVKQ